MTKWPVTLFSPPVLYRSILTVYRTDFYLFISRVWWVAVCRPPPPTPGPPSRGGGGYGGGVRTPFFLSVEVVYFLWCLLGVGGSLDGVGGCEAVGAPCRRCVSVCQSRHVWGVRLALAFGVTSCCSRSLWEPMGGFFPLVLPPRSPSWGRSPVTFSLGDHFWFVFSPQRHRE